MRRYPPEEAKARRLAKRQAEKERARKKRLEEKRKQKEKEKLQKKREAHNKKQRLKEWRRKNHKRDKKVRDYHKSIGDEYGSWIVMVVKDRVRFGQIGKFNWKSNAYRTYNEIFAINQKDVHMPTVKHKYEILLCKKVDDNTPPISYHRDEFGKVVEIHTPLRKNRHYIILEKAEWRVREDFYLYGFHPVRDRKDYEFIFDYMIRNNERDQYDSRQVLVWNNKVIVSYIDGFDFVVCTDKSDALRMYNIMMDDVDEEKLPGIFFMGVVRNRADMSKWTDKFVEKTGWSTSLIKRNHV